MKRILLVVAVLLCFTMTAGLVFALKNVCPQCRTMAQATDVVCKKCGHILNKCLSCGTQNPVSADYCQTCFEPLAEMRVLRTIASDVREDLRLGESERAQLDRELQKLNFQVENDPANRKVYLYRRARILGQMDFAAREAMAWQEYLREFPDTPKKPAVQAFLSEALRKWGYLFYQQGQKKEAMDRFEQAAQTNPMNAEAWSWVARLHSESKQFQAAGDAYLKALVAKPGDQTTIRFLKGLRRAIPPELLVARKAPPLLPATTQAPAPAAALVPAPAPSTTPPPPPGGTHEPAPPETPTPAVPAATLEPAASRAPTATIAPPTAAGAPDPATPAPIPSASEVPGSPTVILVDPVPAEPVLPPPSEELAPEDVPASEDPTEPATPAPAGQ